MVMYIVKSVEAASLQRKGVEDTYIQIRHARCIRGNSEKERRDFIHLQPRDVNPSELCVLYALYVLWVTCVRPSARSIVTSLGQCSANWGHSALKLTQGAAPCRFSGSPSDQRAVFCISQLVTHKCWLSCTPFYP
jgi:hypothetical protein